MGQILNCSTQLLQIAVCFFTPLDVKHSFMHACMLPLLWWLPAPACLCMYLRCLSRSSLPCFSWPACHDNLCCWSITQLLWYIQGVTYTHRTSYLYAMLKCAPDNMSLSCNSCIYAMVPMYHATAWGVPFCAPMVGARLVLPGQLASESCILKDTCLRFTLQCAKQAHAWCSSYILPDGCRDNTQSVLCQTTACRVSPMLFVTYMCGCC